MPAFVTHALFAQQALENSGFALRDCCLRHANLFRFGAQGADVFYFFSYSSPFKGYGALADRLHALESTAPLEALHDIPERDRARAMMCAYLCGCAAHYALDGAMHPIIEERAADIASAAGVSPSCAHAMLESRFEARHYSERTGKQASDYFYEADLPQCAAEREAVARAWAALLQNAGERPLKTEILAREQRKLQKLLALMFSRKGSALPRLLDGARRASHREYALWWQLKRPYRGESEPMTENDYGRLAAAYDEAMKSFSHLMSG